MRDVGLVFPDFQYRNTCVLVLKSSVKAQQPQDLTDFPLCLLLHLS